MAPHAPVKRWTAAEVALNHAKKARKVLEAKREPFQMSSRERKAVKLLRRAEKALKRVEE